VIFVHTCIGGQWDIHGDSTWKLFVLVGAVAADAKPTKNAPKKTLKVDDDATEEVNPAKNMIIRRA
jgi:hypothetical protein